MPPAPRTRARSCAAMPPLVFAGEARALQRLARRGRGRPRVPAAGGRLRRVVPRHLRGHDPREAQDPAADVRRPDLRRRAAGGQGRPHRRAVREAPLGAHGARGGRRPDVVLRPPRQRRRADGRGSRARSAAHAARLRPVGAHAQPAARVRQGRLRRHHARARVEPGVRGQLGRGPPLRAGGERDRARAALHDGLRHRPRARGAAAPGRRLDEPRGPRAGLRGGPHAPRLADRRLVRLLGPHALDRRAHAPARRRARGLLRRRAQPARRQGRRERDAGQESSSCARGSTRSARPGA